MPITVHLVGGQRSHQGIYEDKEEDKVKKVIVAFEGHMYQSNSGVGLMK